jgi:hypothetical protein
MSEYEYYNNLTDQELLSVIDENYYSIGATGAEAMTTLLQDVSEGAWERHGVPTERMKRIIMMFFALLTENNSWGVVAGIDADRKRRVTRLGRLIRAKKR